LKPIIPPWRLNRSDVVRNTETVIMPNVKPNAGETNLVPYTEKAPETGNIEDISPLPTMSPGYSASHENVILTM
jgi:hypothetical protein